MNTLVRLEEGMEGGGRDEGGEGGMDKGRQGDRQWWKQGDRQGGREAGQSLIVARQTRHRGGERWEIRGSNGETAAMSPDLLTFCPAS